MSQNVQSISIPYSNHNPVQFIPEPLPFFTISFTGVVPHHHTNFNLIHMILELTHPKSIIALYHTSFNKTATPSLALSISWTFIYLTTWYLLIFFQFCLSQGKQLEFSLSTNIHPLLPLRSPNYSSYIPYIQPIYTISPNHTGRESVMPPAPSEAKWGAHTMNLLFPVHKE